MLDARSRSVLVVVVALVAFGAVAATLDAGSGPSPDRAGDPPPADTASSNRSDVSPPVASLPAANRTCPGPLGDPSVFALFGGAVVVGGLAVYRWRGSAVLATVVCAPLLVGALGLCPSILANRVPLPTQAVSTILSPPVLAGVVLVVVVGALVYLSVVSGDRGSLDVGDPAPTDAADLDGVGKAAGDAADRIERQADVSNAVYRAWREMVRHLHVPNPDATTPDEFETRAIEAGMNPRDVSELTRLFEDVRYGEYTPADRESRAVDALRRIEDAYADADAGARGADR